MANELVLIIEDNEVNRVLVRDMLRFKGYQTVEAQSAEEGIRVARDGLHGIDAIVGEKIFSAHCRILRAAINISTNHRADIGVVANR